MLFASEEQGERHPDAPGRHSAPQPWHRTQGPASAPALLSHSLRPDTATDISTRNASRRCPADLVPAKEIKTKPHQEATQLREHPHTGPTSTHWQGAETSLALAQRQRRASHPVGLATHVGHRLKQTEVIFGYFWVLSVHPGLTRGTAHIFT